MVFVAEEGDTTSPARSAREERTVLEWNGLTLEKRVLARGDKGLSARLKNRQQTTDTTKVCQAELKRRCASTSKVKITTKEKWSYTPHTLPNGSNCLNTLGQPLSLSRKKYGLTYT